MSASYNWIDYLVLAIILWSIIAGFMRGLVKEIVSLITLVAAGIIAIIFANPLANWIASASYAQSLISSMSTHLGVDTVQSVSYIILGLSYIILFLAVLIIGAVIGSSISYAVAATGIGIINRILGGLFGMIRGVVIVIVIMFLVELTPLVGPAWAQSQFANSFQPAVNWLASLVSPKLADLKAKISQTMDSVGSQTGGFTSGLSDIYQGR